MPAERKRSSAICFGQPRCPIAQLTLSTSLCLSWRMLRCIFLAMWILLEALRVSLSSCLSLGPLSHTCLLWHVDTALSLCN